MPRMNQDDIAAVISEGAPSVKLERCASWKNCTSSGTGTAPFLLAEPADPAELEQLLQIVIPKGIPVRILGAGTNMIGSDRTLDLLFLRLGQNGFSFVRKVGETCLECGAALRLASLANAAAEQGLGGLAPLCGIPGTLGGAIRMNAGANRTEIAQFVREIQGVSLSDGSPYRWSPEEGGWAYRSSPVPKNIAVTKILLELPCTVPEEEQDRILAEKQRRAAVTPKGRSAGSTFRNPPDQIAGILLERAGCKGLSCGAFKVSEQHANWIITAQADSPASEQDYLSVLLQMKQAVYRESRIELQTELCFADTESERLVKEKWNRN